ncbi:N-(5'phosphoribosyl)anthranilate isomerase [Teredinibacter turnerae T7901]|uniref:N-(5'-phosphoribosyl)anthranilate isomerase n=1 Tax=Teredinibacter turnerae (strain ATCC 39867 / T7901) TaxID=377629 RepID=C5BL61_TERTT|nr:phosphoribosylanthranilate isomerase [Teredinibacter turnerae]ACR14365.1 N-(5'phosphoribosyl)anthranilate isomerase [Teredinibacter turnerae T7901]
MRVKICGITQEDDARVAADAGADAIGLVFYEPSPRHLCSLKLARNIALSVGPFVSVVGLFVNPEKQYLEQILKSVPLHLLQFHGEETPEFCESFERPYMKVVRMQQNIDLATEINRYAGASGILLDTYKKGVPGGTGESFNWERVPHNSAKPLVLAGGLSPSNVAQAVKIAQPSAVDVSGGVEAAPGIKDKHKVRAFITSAKSELISD